MLLTVLSSTVLRVSGEIIADSGAAECVMPQGVLPNQEKLTSKAGVRFAAANGGQMGKYGRNIINFAPKGFSTQA